MAEVTAAAATADVVLSSTDVLHASIVNTTIAVTNATVSAVSLKGVAFLPLRLLSAFDRFLFTILPRFLIHTTGLDALTYRALQLFQNGQPAVAVGVQTAEATGPGWSDLFMDGFQASTNKSYWGMLHYITSRWAFTCFAIALVLNRVAVYGSSRQRIVLTWNKRLALRFLPIILFCSQIHQLTQAIRCQTSPDFSLYRYGDNNLYTIHDWSTEGGALHTMSSAALFWSTDEQACAALGMSRSTDGTKAEYGSFSLLWPTFLRLGLSHLVENLSCSLQQVAVMTEVGLSVFEHSLAFAEAESMITHTINKQVAESKSATATASPAATASSPAPPQTFMAASGTITAITDAIQALAGPHLFDRINVPIQVLLVALLSCANCLTAHVLAVIGKKHQWRLVNTAFWGFCYMLAFGWGFFADSDMVRVDQDGSRPISGLVHFPTVAIVGLLPHMMIVLGIIVCGAIYAVALLLTAVSLGTNPNIRQPTSLKERVSIAHDNLQAAIQMRTITIRWYEDFYTALLRIGFAALTAAAEAVFLNEGRAVEMRQFTWLEEDRLDELDASRSMRPSDEAHFQIVEEYGLPHRSDHDGQSGEWKSGYEKEKKLENKEKTLQSKDSFIYPNPRSDGVGALQRTTRFYLLCIFLRGILFTLGGWAAFGMGALLDRLGITARPSWLRKVVGASLKQLANDRNRMRTIDENKRFDAWVQHEGLAQRPSTNEIDIETEMKAKVDAEGHSNSREVLDQRMYEWWKGGGWYGSKDNSGDFIMPSIEQDEDATSVITTTSFASTSTDSKQEEWESEPEGTRTPTQRHMSPSWSFSGLRQRRSETAASEAPILDNTTLARLLNPPDKDSRDEARILSAHLTSTSGIMTRSRFRHQFESTHSKVLLAGRSPPVPVASNVALSPQSVTGPSRAPLTSDEESYVLESLLLTRRAQKARRNDGGHTGLSQPTDPSSTTMNGPPCVVCQSEPRTIIAWPCRCLTVCEDCRVNLAMNNFGNCVTCRRSVGGFVRLYVP